MPTGPEGQKRPADAIGNAIREAQIATGEAEEDFGPEKPEKNEAAAEMGRKSAAAVFGVWKTLPRWSERRRLCRESAGRTRSAKRREACNEPVGGRALRNIC